MSELTILPRKSEHSKTVEIPADDIQSIDLGDWYWFKHGDVAKQFDTDEILCCVMRLGSNYAKIKHPGTDGSSWSWRVHFNEWDELCRYEWVHMLLTAEEYYAGNLDPETLERKQS